MKRALTTIVFLAAMLQAMPQRAMAADLAIQTFASGACTPNLLGGAADDGATMASFSCSDQVFRSTWNATADYYYTRLTPGTSGYDLSGYDYITFDVQTSTNVRLNLRMQVGAGTTVGKWLNPYFPDGWPYPRLQQVSVPIADYLTVTQSTAVYELRFLNYYPAAGSISIDNIYARKESELKVLSAGVNAAGNTLSVQFNVPVEMNSANTYTNYSLSPSLSITASTRTLAGRGRVVDLTLGSALALNTTYTLTVSNISGMNGAALGSRNSVDFIGDSRQAVFRDDGNRTNYSFFAADYPAGPWGSNADIQNGSWVALSTTTRAYGSSSVRVVDASIALRGTRMEHDLGSSSLQQGYFRFYFYIPSDFFNSVGTSVRQTIGALCSDAWMCMFPNVRKNAAGQMLASVYWEDTWWDEYSSDMVPVAPDRWHTMEIYVSTPAAATKARAWVDGNRILSDDGIDLVGSGTDVSTKWEWLYGGLSITTGENDAPVTAQQNYYLDEIVLSSRTFLGAVEKPDTVYASVLGPDTIRVYFNRALSPDEAQWTNTANYSISPSLAVNSASLVEDFRAVELKTALMSDATAYLVTVNSAYLQPGTDNTSQVLGIERGAYLKDDFNRPHYAVLDLNGDANSGLLTTDSPAGPWDTWFEDETSNSISISTDVAYLSKSSVKFSDVNTTARTAELFKNVNFSTDTYVRTYLYIPPAFGDTMATGDIVNFMSAISSATACYGSDTCYMSVYLKKTGANAYNVGLELGDTDSISRYAELPISAGVWNYVEAVFPATGTLVTARLFLNGDKSIYVNGNLNDTLFWNEFEYGLGWSNNLTATHDLYMDELVVSTDGYVGPLEKPDTVYASVIDPNTIKVYFNRPVSETRWTAANTYTMVPSLTVNSASFTESYRAVELKTALMGNATSYLVSVPVEYMKTGAANSAHALGVNKNYYIKDDFNRPHYAALDNNDLLNSALLTVDNPMGTWNTWYDDDAGNSITISTEAAYRTKASVKFTDSSASASFAALVKDVNLAGTTYLRTYMYLPPNVGDTMAVGNLFRVLAVASANAACNAGDSGPCTLCVYVYKAGASSYQLLLEMADTADTWPNGTANITPGVWNSVEVLVPSTGTAANAKLYLNGTQAISITGNISDAQYWNKLLYGMGYANNAAITTSVYMDELLVSTNSYIGTLPDYVSCGLKFWDGAQYAAVACEPPQYLNSKLRIGKAGSTYGIVLTDIDDPNASRIRIQTPQGVRALRKYTQ